MKIFVTGGSGFVGSYLIPRLVEKGYEVVAIARSEESLKKVMAAGALGVKGDITDFESLDHSIAGCDTVVHLAAAFEMWGEETYFYKMNVQGTENLLKAAKKHSIRRFVYVSAASIIANGTPAHMVDETYQPDTLPDEPYSRTKWAAEAKVLASNSPSMTTLALRPPFIWGHGHSMTELMREAVARGRWMWINQGKHSLSTIHVENLCAAIIASLHQGSGGEVYYVTDGETWSVRQFLTAWMQAEGVQLGAQSVPRWLAALFASFMARIWRVFRLRSMPPITPAMVLMLGTELSMTDAKARKVLGYRNMVSIDEGLENLRTATPSHGPIKPNLMSRPTH